MDECTANVDSGTDKLIQHSIRHQFAQATVITVAHRIHSVIDSDRLLVRFLMFPASPSAAGAGSNIAVMARCRSWTLDAWSSLARRTSSCRTRPRTFVSSSTRARHRRQPGCASSRPKRTPHSGRPR